MAVNISRRPTTDVYAKETFLHLSANEVPLNDATTGDEIRHYMTLEASGHDTLRSQNFAGDWVWDGVVLPTAEGWTAHLRKVEDDSSIANLAITAN
jgi:hypothetical protein